jgi:type IV pilus assembly protein PilW
VNRARAKGFNLVELLIALAISLGLVAAFLLLVQRNRLAFVRAESLASLQDSARQALDVLTRDLEHAGFGGFARLDNHRPERLSALPQGVHACGVNYATELARPVQGTDNRYHAGSPAADCDPTPTAGGARASSDTLTVRHLSLDIATPRAGRLQAFSAARSFMLPLKLFADGRAPGVVDSDHDIRDVEVRRYYVANNSVERAGWPALRVKSLTESGGAAQFRDEEVMPGVEDLQLEFGVYQVGPGPRVRFLAPESPGIEAARIVSVRVWLRIRADITEPGFRGTHPLDYAGVNFLPDATEATHRRALFSRTVTLRNQAP